MDDFNLSDFLSQGASVYSTIQNANTTADTAKINQQTAAATAAAAAANATTAATTKQYIVYGIIGLFGILILVFIFKKLK